jgi:AcrR family transcriptional regulator
VEAESRIGGVGQSRRRPRLSDEETARRMLRTAADAVARDGLTVSLDHIRIEDVIRESGVSRSSAYRRWPHKDLFLGELLLELAGDLAPPPTGDRTAPTVVRAVLQERPARLRTPDGRTAALHDIVRAAVERDFALIHESPQWRTYLALTVTAVSLPAGELKDQVQQALATSEARFVEGIAVTFRTLCGLLGMRPRPPADYSAIAQISNAVMRGFVSKALADPDVATQRVTADGRSTSVIELGAIAVVATYIEPDDTTEWDDARTARLLAALDTAEDRPQRRPIS